MIEISTVKASLASVAQMTCGCSSGQVSWVISDEVALVILGRGMSMSLAGAGTGSTNVSLFVLSGTSVVSGCGAESLFSDRKGHFSALTCVQRILTSADSSHTMSHGGQLSCSRMDNDPLLSPRDTRT